MTLRSFFALYASKIRLPLNAQPGFSTGIPRRDAPGDAPFSRHSSDFGPFSRSSRRRRGLFLSTGLSSSWGSGGAASAARTRSMASFAPDLSLIHI